MVIVGDITRFTNKRIDLASRVVSMVTAALLALSFLNLALLPGAAMADENIVPLERISLQAPDEPETAANVFVYLKLEGEALETAEQAGLNLNKDGWFTVGVIVLDGIPKPNEVENHTSIPIDQELLAQIATALKSIDFYPGAEGLSLSAADWTSLRVNKGATDYDVPGNAWHLDGTLSEQLVSFDVHYIDAVGNALNVGDANDEGEKTGTRTILATLGSTVEAADQAIEIEGYKYSEALTKKENGGLSVTVERSDAARSAASSMTLVYEKTIEPVQPENPDESGEDPADKPEVPDNGGSGNGADNGNTKPGLSDNPSIDVPNIDFTLPQVPQGTGRDDVAANNGFAANERTTVSDLEDQKLAVTNAETTEPALVEPEAEAVAEEIAIDDDATPMVARVGGAEAIAEEDVPMGAFDAPVDPAPWVAGLGAIGTALWGVVAVRRRLMMSQQLAAFESQVLGDSAAEACTVAVPNAGHQAL